MWLIARLKENCALILQIKPNLTWVVTARPLLLISSTLLKKSWAKELQKCIKSNAFHVIIFIQSNGVCWFQILLMNKILLVLIRGINVFFLIFIALHEYARGTRPWECKCMLGSIVLSGHVCRRRTMMGIWVHVFQGVLCEAHGDVTAVEQIYVCLIKFGRNSIIEKGRAEANLVPWLTWQCVASST